MSGLITSKREITKGGKRGRKRRRIIRGRMLIDREVARANRRSRSQLGPNTRRCGLRENQGLTRVLREDLTASLRRSGVGKPTYRTRSKQFHTQPSISVSSSFRQKYKSP